MNTVGPLARSIDDLELGLRIVAGPDRRFLETPPVTLTATSSTGALPAGFSWSGACNGSSPICHVNATLSMPPSVIANFP